MVAAVAIGCDIVLTIVVIVLRDVIVVLTRPRRSPLAVHFETDGPVAVVTIDRPEARNAVDRPTADALVDAFARFDADADLCGRGADRRRTARSARAPTSRR